MATNGGQSARHHAIRGPAGRGAAGALQRASMVRVSPPQPPLRGRVKGKGRVHARAKAAGRSRSVLSRGEGHNATGKVSAAHKAGRGAA